MLTPNHNAIELAHQSDTDNRTDVLPPWYVEGYRLVSWWDVEKFAAEKFYMLGVLLQGVSGALERRDKENPDSLLGFEARTKLIDDMELVQHECLKLSLMHSFDAAQEFKEQLNWKNRKWKANEARVQFDNISGLIRREMKRTLFLFVAQDRQQWYQTPLKDWDVVTGRWPKTAFDIEEAAKCFALDRFGGTVFHMMLVAEVGAIEVGNLLQLNDPKIGWQSVSKELKRIERTRFPDLSAIEQEHFALLQQLSPLLLSIENSIRHKISHVANRDILISGEFQPYVAEEVVSATRGFMRRLATDLPK